MSPARDEFIIQAFRLSKEAPNAWREFEGALRAYIAEEVEKSVKASPDTALIAHGRAQALLALRDEFAKLEDTHTTIRNRPQRVQNASRS